MPPNGTGPYRITEVKPGQSILMVKNPDYFKGGFKGEPAICKILYRTIKDSNTRAAELMTGAIDWIWDVPKDQAERLTANPALVVENAKTLRVSYLQFDAHGVSGQKFFTDKRVRQAVAHAINRESLTKNLVGPASVVAHSPCHPDQFGCSQKVTQYPYDPAKAKALLKEAGFPDGFEFDLFAYRDREYTEAVIGDLAKAGLRPKLTYQQYTAFLEAIRKGRTPIAHGTWGSNSIPDVSAMAAHFFLHGPDDHHQGRGGEEADRCRRLPARSGSAPRGVAEGARPHRGGMLLGAAVHLRQVLRVLQGSRVRADVGRDPAVLCGEVEMTSARAALGASAPSPSRGEEDAPRVSAISLLHPWPHAKHKALTRSARQVGVSLFAAMTTPTRCLQRLSAAVPREAPSALATLSRGRNALPPQGGGRKRCPPLSS